MTTTRKRTYLLTMDANPSVQPVNIQADYMSTSNGHFLFGTHDENGTAQGVFRSIAMSLVLELVMYENDSAGNLHGAHPSHCCSTHGCTYGDDACPVTLGKVRQEFPCEQCDES